MSPIIIFPTYKAPTVSPLLYDAAILADGPIAFWKLNDVSAAIDSVGAYDGNKIGTPSFQVPTLVSSSDDYAVEITSGSGFAGFINAPVALIGLENEISEFTIEAWIKPNLIGTNQVIFDKRDGSTTNSNGSFQLRDSGKLRFDKYLPSDAWIDSISTLVAGESYHVVYVEDAISRSIYINGVLDNSDGAPETYSGAACIYYGIGITPLVNTLSFDGTIDNVAIYHTALNSTQVLNHYNIGAGI